VAGAADRDLGGAEGYQLIARRHEMHRFVGEEFYSVARMNLPPALDEFLRKRARRKQFPARIWITSTSRSRLFTRSTCWQHPFPVRPPDLQARGRNWLCR